MPADRAIRLEKPGSFAEIADPLPEEIPSGHARVRIRRIGVCGTDIHAFHGRQPFFEYPRILGHELAGEIVSGENFRPGELVAIEPYLNDPDSRASRRGKTNCCEALRVLGVHCDGGMRTEIDVPGRKLHRAANSNADQLALVEMLGIGHHAVNRSRAHEDDLALVVGAGPIGMSVISFLKTRTPNIAVADLDEGRLAFCREAFGIDRTISPDEEAFEGERPTLIFDATGNRGSMESAFTRIAHGGTIVYVGLFQGEFSVDDPNFHRREITLLASRNATSEEFAATISAVVSGEIDTEPWITHRMSLAEVPERFASTIADPTLRKAVIEV